MIGGLRYLVNTIPEWAYAVGIVSRFMERPTILHQATAKRILHYVKGTLEFRPDVLHNKENEVLIGYSDSDLAGKVEDKRSTGGMVFYLNNSLIMWASQKQDALHFLRAKPSSWMRLLQHARQFG
ncbi:secreted RxLR effector protein 161-like [Apium graveolens]|uniref:secreted RxLR effector protein 161-like n=1 Tax=Apium graveolens TaxID=4045 RepID=UPI003D7B4BD5